MGAKKKGGDAKKKPAKAGDADDDSVEKFYKAYKKKYIEMDVPPSPTIKKLFENFQEEAESFKRIHTSEELGWPGVRAIMDCLKQTAYPHLGSIRLWKSYIEDEGVRAICEFLVTNKTV